MESEVRDAHGRTIDYLRVSVTDRCNSRCVYCMPETGVPHIERSDLLSYEEIARVVRIGASLGIRKVRITGGEPLVRRELPRLVKLVSQIPGIEDLALTTNGLLLGRFAKALAAAGLHRVNVSLDSLRPDRFRAISRGGKLQDVLRGLEAAESEGLRPVKLNMVVMKGVNDDEIEEFGRLTIERAYHVRFIEWMPLGQTGSWQPDGYVSSEEMHSRLASVAPLESVDLGSRGPAKHFRYAGAQGIVGLISPLSESFCDSCNRLRLTSEGRLRPCLLSDGEIELRSLLRSGAPDSRIEELLRTAVEAKPGHYPEQCTSGQCSRKPMSRVGG